MFSPPRNSRAATSLLLLSLPGSLALFHALSFFLSFLLARLVGHPARLSPYYFNAAAAAAAAAVAAAAAAAAASTSSASSASSSAFSTLAAASSIVY